MKRRGRKSATKQFQRVDTQLAREMKDMWAEKNQSFNDMLADIHETMKIVKDEVSSQIKAKNGKITAKQIKDKFRQELKNG